MFGEPVINLKNTKVGRFITFEGGEGGGKSTQTRLLQDTLTSIGVKSILTREPGGSVGAEEIRELIVSGSSDRWDPLTELCLLYAARRDHWLKLIKPNLEQGIWVISDRFADSSIVYQGYAGEIELDTVLNIHNVVLGDVWPDLTIVLDLPPEVGLERSNKRDTANNSKDTRFEKRELRFHKLLREGFQYLQNKSPDRICVIDGAKTIKEVELEVFSVIQKRFVGLK